MQCPWAKWMLIAVAALGGCSKTPIEPSGEVSLDLATVPEAASIEVGPADWPWWRGPNHNGIADSDSAPLRWSETENIVWKASVPGRGHADPTVVGNRVFLPTADEAAQVQSVLCYDRATGDLVWQVDVHQGEFESSVHSKNTQASSTIACDGQRIFAAFLNGRQIWVTALSLDGDRLWQTSAGAFQSTHGYSASPLLYGPLVIVAGDNEGGGFLAALHRETGEVVWRKRRPSVTSFASPVVHHVAGRDQLLICGGDLVVSYDPTSGDQLWSVTGTTKATVGTMVFDGDVVFASGGYPGKETLAIRADGSEQVVWRNNQKSYVPSLLLHEGYVYQISDDGRAFCWKADTGEEQWRSRLGGNYSASPILAGEAIYVPSEAGETVVFRATPERFELLEKNRLGDAGFASPVICGGQIFLRTADGRGRNRQEYLYCIGE
jgi:outer membrane protein assembly factor BamB